MGAEVSVPISCLWPCPSERSPPKQFVRQSEHRVAESIYEKIQRRKVKIAFVSGLCHMVQVNQSQSGFFSEHMQTEVSPFSPPQTKKQNKNRCKSHI